MGGRGSGSAVSTINLIPAYAQPTVKQYVLDMKALSENDLLFAYTAATYATQSFDETDGIARLSTRAAAGSVMISKGETVLRDTYDGTKLNANPKMDELFAKKKEAIIQEFDEEILPRIDAAFNAIGRFGGGSHHVAQTKAAEVVMKKISDLAYEVYGGGYWTERVIQVAALRLSIPFGTQEVKDIELQRKVGLFKREFTQGANEDAFRRDRANVDARIKRIEILGNAIRTVLGAHVTRIEPLHMPGAFQQMAGIALTGLSLYGMAKGAMPGQQAATPTGGGMAGSYSAGSMVPTYTLEGM